MTPLPAVAKLPLVHRLGALCGTLLLFGYIPPATAQAPASADMWRLSAATLAGPPALEVGASAAFWNPAAAWGEARLRVGAQLLQTPDILGVTGLLAGASYRWSRELAAQVLAGRTQVTDLVRTTTSPTSELGSIPVYEQLVAVGAAWRHGAFTGGALLSGHNARFDAERDRGATLDVGIKLAVPRLSIAGATHLYPLDLRDTDVTDFYGAAEVQPVALGVWGAQGRVLVRYGLSARRGGGGGGGGGVEHGGGLGLELDQGFRLDAALVRETGYGDASWRPTVGVQLRVGRYAITAARSSGLGGVGASYRIGLDVDAHR